MAKRDAAETQGRVGRVSLSQDDARMWAAQAREVFHAPVRVHARTVSAEGVSAVVWVVVVFDGAHRAATTQTPKQEAR